MTIFEYVSVAVSFVLGLGITRLMLSMVRVVRWRDRIVLHWIPFSWALVVLIYQFQFWWAVFELNAMVTQWTMTQFVNTVGMAVFLFAAGALLLPEDEPERGSRLLDDFDCNGQWALGALVIYFVSSLWGNWFFWHMTPLEYPASLVPLLIVSIGAYGLIRHRGARSVITLLNLPLAVFSFIEFSPAAY